ncbi:Gfo/Idh/MocA family protein [Aspergillus undulatus]|uniref:Gfo/Idh/MocA family protein n=1 Tax=Aspergillus undulatus TaxID=1810928 RepID=UPI003CCE303E
MPLRTALLGLSSHAKTSWASTAHLPALTTPKGRSLFTITALCNSSTEAAQSAIDTYNLDPSVVKAYGTPEDLAADDEVDFVICTTRVDKHLETVLPSLRAGKGVYLEWPIAANLGDVERLVDVAAENRADGKRNGVVAVGLQGRFAPPVLKVKEVLGSGVIGRLVSSEVRFFGGTNDREFLPPGLKYFAERGVGGNVISIGFAHVIDLVQSVVGDVIPGSEDVHFQLQRPSVRVRDPQTKEIVETIQSDVPDLVNLHGTLPESDHVSQGASLITYFARGQPYPGDPALTWTLTGERGAIRLVAPSGTSLQADAYAEPVTISVHRFDTDQVEKVPWDWSADQKEVAIRGRSVLSCLYSIGEGKDEYVSLEDAARRARQVLGWLDSFYASSQL